MSVDVLHAIGQADNALRLYGLKNDDIFRVELAQARAAISELIAAAKDGADDLEAEIQARAQGELPRRIDRDMETVRRLRAALAAVGGEGQG